MLHRLRAELLDDAGAALGEGPSWDARTGELVWVDILSGVLHVHGPDGDHRRSHQVGGHVGSAMPAEEGGWLLATVDGFAHLARDGTVSPLLAVEEDPELRFNDAKCDPWGQAVAGTMRYDETAGSASLYRLEVEPVGVGAVGAPLDGLDRGRPGAPALAARPLLRGLGLANGLAWSADGGMLFFIDSLAYAVARFPYSPDGDLGPDGEVVAVDPTLGIPDGMCADHAGCLWVALHGGGAIHRYRPDGQLDTVVEVPVPHPTSVAFGGPAGDQLFITTAGRRDGAGQPEAGPATTGLGGLWVVQPGVSGPPATPWRRPERVVANRAGSVADVAGGAAGADVADVAGGTGGTGGTAQERDAKDRVVGAK